MKDLHMLSGNKTEQKGKKSRLDYSNILGMSISGEFIGSASLHSLSKKSGCQKC